MKTTIEIADALFAEARTEARRRGTSMRSLVEEGLRRLLDDHRDPQPYVLEDRSVEGELRPEYLEGGPDAFYAAAYGGWSG